MREQYPRYFDALNQHPRLLVGQEVPSIGKDGTETLRDSADAKDWQDAVKSALMDEIKGRVEQRVEGDSDVLSTLHQSIELFQNNSDMVPGTKQFDRELADQFAKMAKPYEVRIDGKLNGYSIPIQPLVEQVRKSLQTQRAAQSIAGKPAPAGGKTTSRTRKPQSGISSKAGSSAEDKEDFSTLFGTLGIPDFRI